MGDNEEGDTMKSKRWGKRRMAKRGRDSGMVERLYRLFTWSTVLLVLCMKTNTDLIELRFNVPFDTK